LINAVLIDDEIDSNRILQTLLENYCPQVRVVGMADGVETATALIRGVKPDLVFMDIEMTEGNAFDLLNRLQPIGFHVIFVTAFDNHAVRAFRYNAIDYLLKPVNIRELRAAVDKNIRQGYEDNRYARARAKYAGKYTLVRARLNGRWLFPRPTGFPSFRCSIGHPPGGLRVLYGHSSSG
jgi:DNA-binding LytR/AlgR family response regulator